MEDQKIQGVAFDWQHASYGDWNERLLAHCLGERKRGSIIERIPATPEELTAVVGDPTADAEQLAGAFVKSVREKLPQGTSFCGFCLRSRVNGPDSSQVPHYFGMLWFTCLLAAGFGAEFGSFGERFRELVGTADNLRHGKRGCLNELWEALAEWTQRADGYGKLILPPPDDHLVVIGRSYYLAFPNRHDRRVLAEVLTAARLVGFEPPILPVVRSVERARNRFSHDFRVALDAFVKRFLRAGRDPKDSAFWRAIREEVLVETDGTTRLGRRQPTTTLLGNWDDDDVFQVRLATTKDGEFGTLRRHPLPIAHHDLTHYLGSEQGDAHIAVQDLLDGVLAAPLRLRSLCRQGVLLFRPLVAGDYCLAQGADIEGADVALVRRDRASAFVSIFGGQANESCFKGWVEVEGCRVEQLTALPGELVGVSQLLLTTSAPRPRLVGGIQVDGGYLWLPEIGPRVRTPSAFEVTCILEGVEYPCHRAGPNEDWNLPRIELAPPTRVEFRARYRVEFDGIEFDREGRTGCRFVTGGHGCDYKTIGTGNFWREGIAKEQEEQSGHEEVPIVVGETDPRRSADLGELAPTVRYLGPGVGEISSRPSPSHPWLVLGSRRHPSNLIYRGDLSAPILPDDASSPVKRDRTSWRYAFTSKNTRVSALVNGRYVPLAKESRLAEVHAIYRRRARQNLSHPSAREVCPDPRMSHGASKPKGVQPTGATALVRDAVAARGVMRRGFALREFQALIGHLTGREDYLLWQQIVRAWSEAGLVDLLRRQDRSQTLVVPRRPTFVMVRRGPSVDATLLGLAPTSVVQVVEGYLKRHTDLHRVLPPSPFQPDMVRVTGATEQLLREVSREVGLPNPLWLRWTMPSQVPKEFTVRTQMSGLVHGDPPEAYVLDARWDWEESIFRRYLESGELVEVERRQHPQRCSIYVVCIEGDPMFWCHLRSWSLLRAAELRDTHPFACTHDGAVATRGRSPMHLPL